MSKKSIWNKVTVVKSFSSVAMTVAMALVCMGCNNPQEKKQTATNGIADMDSVAVVDSTAVPTESVTSEDAAAVKAFVEKFYDELENKFMNYDDVAIEDTYAYLKQHVTDQAYQYLKDMYEYDCEGECLAVWMFFYQGGGDVGGLDTRSFTVQDANHVLVNSKYENYKYDVLLTVKKVGDEYKIDDIEPQGEEYIDH